MTNDDRDDKVWGQEGGEPEIFRQDDASDPAAAFDALRDTVEDLAADLGREMTTIRKGVESAFDQLERQGAAVDYSAELGRMTQQLTVVGEHLQAIHQAPVLRQGAEHYARVLERSGEGLVRSAVQKLEGQASDLERISNVLASHNKSALHRKDQDFRMWVAAGIGVVAGVFLLAFVPRFLPFSADNRVASLVMGKDVWNAGVSLMTSADPATVRRVAEADRLVIANRDALSECRAAASKAGKEQKCTIVVPAPEKAQ